MYLRNIFTFHFKDQILTYTNDISGAYLNTFSQTPHWCNDGPEWATAQSHQPLPPSYSPFAQALHMQPAREQATHLSQPVINGWFDFILNGNDTHIHNGRGCWGMNQPRKAALEKPAALTAVMGRATPSFKEQESFKTYSWIRTIPVDNSAYNTHPTLVLIF